MAKTVKATVKKGVVKPVSKMPMAKPMPMKGIKKGC